MKFTASFIAVAALFHGTAAAPQDGGAPPTPNSPSGTSATSAVTWSKPSTSPVYSSTTSTYSSTTSTTSPYTTSATTTWYPSSTSSWYPPSTSSKPYPSSSSYPVPSSSHSYPPPPSGSATPPYPSNCPPNPNSNPLMMSLPLTYDNTYDNGSGSMNSVACSNGPKGLVERFPTFSDLPTFPYIGGAFAVGSWSSPNCGSCWSLTYPQTGVTIKLIAIDTSGVGFNAAQAAMDKLTGGKANQLGRIEVNAYQLPASECKL
uniref:Cerato-platanin 2 n=1 Tax=Heterobasidion irregulare TaxID=984962 RepID=A0A0A1IXC4_9AGAM|nr:cerato-platanin 2 [Heterobasidion irregulare]